MKTRKWLCVITALVLVFGLSAFVMGCSKGDSNKVEVRWYDGTTVLKTDKVKKGATATEWTPTKDGKEFMGWYADTLFTNPFDFTAPINERTNIYADWRTTPAKADTRLWFAVGGSYDDTFDDSTLIKSNWTFATKGVDADEDGEVDIDNDGYATFEKVAGKEDLVMTQEDGKNVYKIDLTLRAGDKFRFLTSALNESDWTGDKGLKDIGMGAIAGFTYAAGVNPESSTGEEVTLADKKRGEIRDASGKLVFEGGQEFNADPKTWNFFVVDGADGVYTFTLTTYPGEDRFDTLTWELKESKVMDEKIVLIDSTDPDLDALEVESFKYRNGKWTGTYRVSEAATVQLKNKKTDALVGEAIQLTDAGTWSFVYDPQTQSVSYEVAQVSYYLGGDFADLYGSNFGKVDNVETKTAELEMQTADNGKTFTYNLTVAYSRHKDWYPAGSALAVRVLPFVESATGGNATIDWSNGASATNVQKGSDDTKEYYTLLNGNIFLSDLGKYLITYDVATGMTTVDYVSELSGDDIVVTPLYIIGTFVDGELDAANKVNFEIKGGFSPKMTTTDGITYTATGVEIRDVTSVDDYNWMGDGNIFCWKLATYADTIEDGEIVGGSAYTSVVGNQYLTEAGVYTFTFNALSGDFTAVKTGELQ